MIDINFEPRFLIAKFKGWVYSTPYENASTKIQKFKNFRFGNISLVRMLIDEGASRGVVDAQVQMSEKSILVKLV